MPSKSSRSRPASRTSLSEPTGSASRTAIRLPPRLERRLHCIDAHRMERVSTVFDSDVFEVEQLLRPMVNIYKISSRGLPVAFVRQKRMAVKEDIRFFADESETQELFRIKARSLMEFGGRYDVITPAGERIGVLGKVFGKSLLRSTWSVMDANEQQLATATARSTGSSRSRWRSRSTLCRAARRARAAAPPSGSARDPASSAWSAGE